MYECKPLFGGSGVAVPDGRGGVGRTAVGQPVVGRGGGSVDGDGDYSDDEFGHKLEAGAYTRSHFRSA